MGLIKIIKTLIVDNHQLNSTKAGKPDVDLAIASGKSVVIIEFHAGATPEFPVLSRLPYGMLTVHSNPRALVIHPPIFTPKSAMSLTTR